MPIEMGTQGQPDFTQPVELMMDCHRRIERFLDVLRRVADRYCAQPLDDQGREALRTALTYFKQAAPRHTADEEESLFPRMRALDNPAVEPALERIRQLEADHRHVEQDHVRLEALGQQWLRDGRLDDGSLNAFVTLLGDMSAAYAQHIEIEDHEVFTIAAAVLSSEALEAVGREMRERRVENPGREGSRCAQRRGRLDDSDLDATSGAEVRERSW